MEWLLSYQFVNLGRITEHACEVSLLSWERSGPRGEPESSISLYVLMWWPTTQTSALVSTAVTLNPGVILRPVISHIKQRFPTRLLSIIMLMFYLYLFGLFKKKFFCIIRTKPRKWLLLIGYWKQNSNNTNKNKNRNSSHLWGFYYILISLHELPRHSGKSLRK